MVYPIIQMTPILQPLSASTELSAISSILGSLGSLSPNELTSSWTFTAGYFNPKKQLIEQLLETKSSNCTVITAHPHANGFFGSPGVSGLLPSAYTLLARRFLQAVLKHDASQPGRIRLQEWRRGELGKSDGWTYHAKGLWVALGGERGASISVIGSSNYTARSYELDLEAGAVIVTSNEVLRQKLGEERDGLGVYARDVGLDEFERTDRRVTWKVRLAMWIVKAVGGSL